MDNKKIADLFSEIADMMEIEDEKRVFEVRAYRKAALTVETLQEDVAEIVKKDGVKGLMELPGIGKSLAESIKEYVETGKMKKYNDLKKKYPLDLFALTQIEGLGPKRAYKLYQKLGVKDIATLKTAVEKHKVKDLEGFGEKSEAEIAKGLLRLESQKGRFLLGTALPEAEAIVKEIKGSGLIDRVEIAGSTRRMRETIGDLDVLVTSEKPDKVMDFVSKMREVESVVLSGPTKTTVRLRIGMNCDIRVVEEKSFGAALQYFIGSKAHNVKLRQIAIKKGYKLNEYGLFDKKDKNQASREESDIYQKLGLQYMEPEMREDKGEIELAVEHKIPRLVQLTDIKGDLHVHSTYTDGLNSLEEMANEAIRLGREYIGFTDHSKSEYVAKGMDEKRYEAYIKETESLKKKLEGRIEILRSAETDILKDGSLDFSRKTLEGMDYVLAAVHMNTNMPREEMTKRYIKCIESNMVDIIAHPTGRLINQRSPINVDLDKVFEAAKDHNVVMEIDSFPDRLDLNDENIFKARGYNLKFSIDTDSHRTQHLQFIRYGVGTAKRGWARKEDIINTMPFKELVKHFKNA